MTIAQTVLPLYESTQHVALAGGRGLAGSRWITTYQRLHSKAVRCVQAFLVNERIIRDAAADFGLADDCSPHAPLSQTVLTVSPGAS